MLAKIAVPFALATCLVGCSGSPGDPKKAIVGTWESENQNGAVWVFNADGTATETLNKADKQSKYTYTVVDGDKIDLVSEQPRSDFLSEDMREKSKLAGVDTSGPLRLVGQYKFDGRDRLVLLLSDIRPTRIAEAERADDLILPGKGGGVVTKLRRKKN